MTIQTHAQARAMNQKPKLQTARVVITDQGYSRTRIVLRRGVPTRITFLRQTDATCATEVVIPAYGINRSLPLNTPIAVSFTPKRSGEFNFTCGMNMMRGKLVVQ
ncbi:MAG: cupredoxin domain-containing protein [Chloracidobacterium sp.]|nr:cupredoxin domain-containing protein [Chloracidobacterium sp.]